jgi:membrane associated rhomboid family serine protease
MLEDRSYMRDPMRSRWSMTLVLMVLNVAVFAWQEINRAYVHFPLGRYFALSKEGLSDGYVWQLLTFQFLHGGILHLVFNLLGIYFFGRPVEERLGKAGLLKVYFAAGTVGGLLQTLLGAIWAETFGQTVVGASAGVFGLIAAFAMLEPDGVILLFFVLPVRAKYLVVGAAAIALFYILVPVPTGVAHAAHLGGLMAGVVYMRWGAIAESFLRSRRPIRPRLRPRELVKVRSPKSWLSQKAQAAEELPPEEFISREVDPILEKISAHGIHSLTPKERQILEAARHKMRRRQS